ncbi:hypothetical protein [Shimia thalassica]|uniref:hypothetical protein n=1 Tax=Shimia thalassica TaxID=1715693 RepID=UPI0026E1FE40|nr:hypothetical protein [Shimia thalassica]MDO6480959.1 hypothetical protein [Shimia thalassica]
MQIDLKNPAELTHENVRRLLASKDDSEHRQLRVSDEGVAYISDDVGLDNLNGVATRFETWSAGNEYCGLKAAADDKWVASVLDDLRHVWPDPPATYIDYDMWND